MVEEEKMTTEYDRIHRRSGHVAVNYKNLLIVWGGYTELPQVSSTSPIFTVYYPTDELWSYDCNTELWERILLKGQLPPRCSGSCGVILDDYLYVFGGYCVISESGHFTGNSNNLYRLKLTTLTWEHLHPGGEPKPACCDKLVGWEHNKKLYFFGGFGSPPEYIPSDARYQHVIDNPHVDRWQSGWNNQLACYCPLKNCWEWPLTNGVTPLPRAAHAVAKSGNSVYIFGGRHRSKRMNDLYCLDMNSMTWSKNLNVGREDGPVGRSWHSFTFLTPYRAVIYGGLDEKNGILSDCWILELPSVQWLPYKSNEPRLWHRGLITPYGELVIIGGYRNNIYDATEKDHAEELLTISFTPKSLRRLCIDVVLEHCNTLKDHWRYLPKELNQLLLDRLAQL